MTWIKLAEPPKPVHRCVLPTIPPHINPGSIWQCDGCPKQWVICVRDIYGDPTKYFSEVPKSSVFRPEERH